jgi:HEPN domain-containing protein
MDRAEELRQWFFLADEDLRAAEILSNHYPTPDSIICFHCQQSAEKYLKGFLLENNAEPPKIHDLAELLERCEQIRPAFSAVESQCDFLNRYSVLPRCPREWSGNPHDVETAVKYAGEVKAFVGNMREKPEGTTILQANAPA